MNMLNIKDDSNDPNRSSKIAILIKDDTRTCTKSSNNEHFSERRCKNHPKKSQFAKLSPVDQSIYILIN